MIFLKSIKLCGIKNKYITIDRCLHCQWKKISAAWKKSRAQRYLCQIWKIIDEFSNIVSAKACAIMILFNALSKDTIRAIVDEMPSDTSSFITKH